MKSARPTLRSLAAEAGVSAMTVSLALRNRAEIPLRTRQRLQRLAKQRGYQPDPTLNKLMQHLRTTEPTRNRANICGLFEAASNADFAQHPFFARLTAGLQRQAEVLGFSFSQIKLPERRSRGKLQAVLRNRGIEGLVLLPMPDQTNLADLLNWQDFSVVSVTTSVVAPRVHRVTPHHFDNMAHACRQLTRRGFKRIGLAITQRWNERVRFRWTGAIAWQNAFGGTTPVPPFLGSTAGPTLDDAGFAAWVRRHKPDAILVEAIDNDLLERACARLGLQARPVVIAMDRSPEDTGPGIDQKPEAIGSVAIETLAGMIYRGERGLPVHPLSIAVEGEWIEGAAQPAKRGA
jgi:DNA-binding LacI/PurR family transcriptional regulator